MDNGGRRNCKQQFYKRVHLGFRLKPSYHGDMQEPTCYMTENSEGILINPAR